MQEGEPCPICETGTLEWWVGTFGHAEVTERSDARALRCDSCGRTVEDNPRNYDEDH